MTFFWVLSDFLSGKNESLEITENLIQDSEVSDLVKMAADRTHKGSGPALWMLLLLRLTTVASDDRLDLRNSAIQTLLRIFDAYGHRLSPEAWSICVKSVIFKLLTSLEEELQAEDGDELDRKEWNGTAVVVLDGISDLLANYLGALTQHSSFSQLWRQLLRHLTTLLDFNALDINTATYKALGHILSQTSDEGRPTFNKETVDLAWELWSRSIPVSNMAKADDNQYCLIAYVAALSEVYRLIQADLTVERAQKILRLLRQAVEDETVGGYVSDIEQMTQLQSQILNAVQMLRTDVEGVPSAVAKQVSDFITLAFEKDQATANQRRTYVAMSKASMQMLETLILKHASDKDIYNSGALPTALSALCKPISLKYAFPIVTRSVQPWKLATTTALVVLQPTLAHLTTKDFPKHTAQRIWTTVVAIADGILSADCDIAPQETNFTEDENFDVASFRKLRQFIIPSLGAEQVQDKARKAYAESLFKTSLIHAAAPADEAIINDAGLPELYKPRAGRTVAMPPTKRSQIAFVALDELFALVSIGPKRENSMYIRIARTAAPSLILRTALPLRSYIADQPLRGLMPQPLSQRRELLWVLRRLVVLRSEGEAIPGLEGCESVERRHLLRLYPLVVGALGVGGDGEVLGLLRGALEVVGGELGF